VKRPIAINSPPPHPVTVAKEGASERSSRILALRDPLRAVSRAAEPGERTLRICSSRRDKSEGENHDGECPLPECAEVAFAVTEGGAQRGQTTSHRRTRVTLRGQLVDQAANVLDGHVVGFEHAEDRQDVPLGAQRTARSPAPSRGNQDSAGNRSRLSPTRPKMLPGRTILRRKRKSDCAGSGGLPDQKTTPSANTHLQRRTPPKRGSAIRDQEVESPVSAPKARLPMTHRCHLSSRRRRSLARGTRVFVLRKGRGLWAFRSPGGVNLQVGPAVSSGPTSCLSYGFLGLLPP
jgi:hypothetical protein